MVKKKIKSKRIKLSVLHKREKLARRNQSQKRRRARKHPEKVARKARVKGVPNMWPFKAEFLATVEQEEREEELMKQRDRERVAAEREAARQAREAEREAREAARLAAMRGKALKDLEPPRTAKEQLAHLRTMFDTVDVALEVVDARDPQHLRAASQERALADRAKPLVLVLAKADLVPPEVVSAWRTRLAQEHPCASFYTITHRRSTGVTPAAACAGATADSPAPAAAVSPAEDTTSAEQPRVEHSSADEILAAIREAAASVSKEKEDDNDKITVGVFGVEAVGKRTFVASLQDACGNPARDEATGTVALAADVALYPMPAVVPQRALDARNTTPFALALLHTGAPATEADVERLLEHAPAQQLLARYSIGTWRTTHELLVRVAQRRGRLRKGGAPDADAAVRIVINDIVGARLPFWTEVPTKEQEEREMRALENGGDEMDDEEEDDGEENMTDGDEDDEDEDEEDEDDDRLHDDEEDEEDEDDE